MYAITEDEFRDIVLDDLDELRRLVRGILNLIFLGILAGLLWMYRGEVAKFFSELPGVGDG